MGTMTNSAKHKMTEGIIQRDAKGMVRFKEPVPMTDVQVREVVEQVYLHGHVNLKYHQLESSFAEYDGAKGVKPGTARKWTDEERKIVLKTVDENPEKVGEMLGRTGMSVFMHRAHVLAEFQSWKNAQEDKGVVYATYDEAVDAFFKEV